MENNTNTQKINVLDIIRVFVSYWPLLLISTVFFLAAGIFYLKIASKTYMVESRIAVLSERRRTSGTNTYVNVNALMFQERSLENEISYLRSSPLIEEVINKMNLFTSYYIQSNKIPKELPFSFSNLYKDSPFIVIIDKNSPQPINTLFYINVIDEERFVIEADEPEASLYYSNNESVSEYEIHFSYRGVYEFGELIENDYCSFRVLLNSNYDSKLYQGQDLFFRFNNPKHLAQQFQESLSINTSWESSIVDLTFEAGNLELGLDFLQELITTFIDKNLEKKNYDANNTLAYIDEQLATISGSLGQSERELQNFRSSRDIMNIDEKTTNLNRQLQNFSNDRDEVQQRLQNLIRLEDYFETNKNLSTFIAPSYIGISDATLATLIEELTNLSRERQGLISTNQLKNPRIEILDANIATIKSVISENIKFSLQTAQDELNEILRKIETLDNEFTQLPQTQRQLITLERRFNIEDAVYTTLLDKKMQAQIIKASNLPDCSIIEPVRSQDITSPNIKKIAVIAIFLGLFFPSIYIIIVNFLSQRIRTKEEISRYCPLPNIGYIPSIDKPTLDVIANFPQSPVAERVHSIRSSIIYHLLGETNKCILVTSTIPYEGKSFTSLNLAQSFASSYKTLLISFDLRKNSGTLAELKIKALLGLSSYLINMASLEDITVHTENPNLDIVHNGEIPPNPVALLSSSKTKEFFEEVKHKYDYIVVDTPPFGLVTDAFLLMQYADISLYVLRLGYVTKKALKQSMDDIKTKNIKKIYSLYNGITKIEQAYSQKYAYKDQKQNWISRITKRNK